MEIVYKKLTFDELDTFIDMRIKQLTEEYESEGKEVPKDVDLRSALNEFYHRHIKDCTFVSFPDGGHMMMGHEEEVKKALHEFTEE